MNAASPERYLWVDVARGLGIVLVVYAHVLRGHFPAPDMGGWAQLHNHVIYAFHMPLFFVLSGLFIWQALEKGSQRFISARWWQIVYPYLLWSFVTAAIELSMAPYVNSPLSVRSALLIPVVPIEQYWFLYALLVHQLVVALIFPSKALLPVVAVAGLVLVAVLGGELIQIRAFSFLPYFVAGVLLANSFHALASGSARVQGALFLGGFVLFAALLSPPASPIGPIQITLLVGLVGSLGTIGAAMLLARTAAARPIALLGEASLAIFLAHTIVSAGARIGLKLVGIAPTSPISLITATLLGLLAPLLLFVWARQKGHMQVLGFGGQPRRAVAVS